jgi:hypothetical protein
VTHPIWISTVFSLLAGLIFSMQALSSFQGKGSHFRMLPINFAANQSPRIGGRARGFVFGLRSPGMRLSEFMAIPIRDAMWIVLVDL